MLCVGRSVDLVCHSCLVGELCLPYSDLLVGIHTGFPAGVGCDDRHCYLPELAGGKRKSGDKHKNRIADGSLDL